ncbi:MAG: bifunctional UDP-N-acetylglucosamine diphosphorylase/glucosamine-1-phosphate N-acetyltransferase GlmU [Oscillospiraceae bacterium]|nr:bifunctional UDP-N-acetylglucosamine diphosphorylase/glucosamine-1-phosphate N-acetyltransferase GlmU [Oscillospiraceae bacterium]
MGEVCAVVLAAGDGKRMRSARPKVLCEVLFRPMIGWIADTLAECGIGDVCAVLGAGADQVRAAVPQFSWVEQRERLGTGHAVMQARAFLEGHRGGNCVVLCGDAPFVDAKTLREAYRLHKQESAAATLVTAFLPDPTGYGRILRDGQGNVSRIVEQADADEKIRRIQEINAGTYWFSVDFLLDALEQLRADNAQGEYYLTDVIGIAAAQGRRVCGYEAADSRVAMGANDRKGLLRLNELARQAQLERHLDGGVEIICADGVVIQPGVQIGPDTTILPGTILKGNTVIGKNCVLGPNTIIEDSVVGDGCQINACQIEQSRLDENVKIGPYTHVRPNSHLKAGVKIGNFVEVKNSVIDERTAVAHLTYVGDSDVGKNVNFGCGTVTVNFDGHDKYRTVIGDDCFIGCNSNLIAPVEIGSGSYIAAGSTITDMVPQDALAIARARQVVKPGWAAARRLRLGPRKK